MGSNTCLVCLVILWSLFISYVRGDITRNEEELRWEKEFRLMQKPSVKTIKTEYGDVYDCVDFYKQPAFDHPLLKNHTFHPQMRPSSIPKTLKVESSSGENVIKLDDIRLKDGGCPTGTVPIRRVSKDEYIQMRRFTKQYASQRGVNGLQPQPGTHLAIAQTKYKPGTIYNGVGAYLSIHNPAVTSSEYSSAEMIIQSGSDSIQVGWTVNPALNKDNHTRFFQYLNAGQSHCFNNLCPGFVSVRTDIPIDYIFHHISIYGKVAYIVQVFVYQDAKSGNWWLQIKDDTVIGFWPQQIFSGLAHSATYIAIGGEAYSPPGQPLPPMGNGHYATEETTLSAYCKRFFVLDENHEQIDTQDTEEYRDMKNYAVFDMGIDKKRGRYVFYGGPY